MDKKVAVLWRITYNRHYHVNIMYQFFIFTRHKLVCVAVFYFSITKILAFEYLISLCGLCLFNFVPLVGLEWERWTLIRVLLWNSLQDWIIWPHFKLVINYCNWRNLLTMLEAMSVCILQALQCMLTCRPSTCLQLQVLNFKLWKTCNGKKFRFQLRIDPMDV